MSSTNNIYLFGFYFQYHYKYSGNDGEKFGKFSVESDVNSADCGLESISDDWKYILMLSEDSSLFTGKKIVEKRCFVTNLSLLHYFILLLYFWILDSLSIQKGKIINTKPSYLHYLIQQEYIIKFVK